MELTAPGAPAALPLDPTTSPHPLQPMTQFGSPATAGQTWIAQPGTAQAWTPAPVAPPTWAPPQAVAPAWPPAAAPTAVATPAHHKRSGRSRAVDVLFSLSVLVAVGGVAFAVGRETAPKAAATAGAGAGLARGGFGAGAGTGPGVGTAGTGTGPGAGQGAIVAPAASGAPAIPDQQQQPAASVAPADQAGGAATGPGTGTTRTPGQGGPGGFGRGGLTGSVSAVGDGTITFTSSDGQATDVATSDTTTFHRQTAATADDVAVGSFVRITTAGAPGGGFGGGQGGQPGSPTASTVPGAAPQTAVSASDVEILLEAPAPATGGGRRGGLSGTVTALGDGTLTFTAADGQTTEVATSDVTTYHQQAVATAADVVVGSSIRVTAVGGGFGGGQPGGPGSGAEAGTGAAPAAGAGAPALSASDVEILLPAGQ